MGTTSALGLPGGYRRLSQRLRHKIKKAPIELPMKDEGSNPSSLKEATRQGAADISSR